MERAAGSHALARPFNVSVRRLSLSWDIDIYECSHFRSIGPHGGELVQQALTQGHLVTAFVRDPAKLDIKHAHLKVRQGDVTKYASVERAVTGQEAVLCALGSFTPTKRDPTLIDAVRNIIQAMEQASARRLIYLSFLAVRESRRELGPVVNYIVAPLLRNPIADHEAKEIMIKQSGTPASIAAGSRLRPDPLS